MQRLSLSASWTLVVSRRGPRRGPVELRPPAPRRPRRGRLRRAVVRGRRRGAGRTHRGRGPARGCARQARRRRDGPRGRAGLHRPARPVRVQRAGGRPGRLEDHAGDHHRGHGRGRLDRAGQRPHARRRPGRLRALRVHARLPDARRLLQDVRAPRRGDQPGEPGGLGRRPRLRDRQGEPARDARGARGACARSWTRRCARGRSGSPPRSSTCPTSSTRPRSSSRWRRSPPATAARTSRTSAPSPTASTPRSTRCSASRRRPASARRSGT